MHTCNVSMVDYMNTNNMPHKHVTLSNDPRDEIYLDRTTVKRYKKVVSDIQHTINLFEFSTRHTNNHAAQIKPLEDIIDNIRSKLKRECRHKYTTKNGNTICKICSISF